MIVNMATDSLQVVGYYYSGHEKVDYHYDYNGYSTSD